MKYLFYSVVFLILVSCQTHQKVLYEELKHLKK
jgi:hypothetical protein